MWAGWITFGTRNDTSKFDKQYADIEKKIKDLEQKGIETNTKIVDYEKEKQQLQNYKQEMKNAEKEIEDYKKSLKPSEKMGYDSDELKALEQNLADITRKYQEQFTVVKKGEDSYYKMRAEVEQQNEEVSELKAKLESIDLHRQQDQLKKLKNGFNDVGKSIQGSVKNIGRMIVGIFGIRSAYMMLRQASSTLSQYDEQYASNLEYIRWMLAQAIAPVLRYIVNLAGTLLNYILAILQTWFGLFKSVDLSAKAFNNMKKGAGGVAKAAKEIHKQLAGFDEMNILQDTSSSGGGGGAGGAGPSLDFGKAVDEGKLAKIKDHLKEILSIIGAIVGVIALLKIGLGGITALGIGIAIGGAIYAITSLIDYLKDPTWENFGKIITGLGVAILGIGIATNNVYAIVIGAVIALSGFLVKNWDKISSAISSKLKGLQDKVESVREKWGDGIATIYTEFVGALTNMYNWFKTSLEAYRLVFDGLIKFVDGIIHGDWKKAWEGAKDILVGIVATMVNNFVIKWQLLLNAFMIIIGAIQTIFIGLKDFVVEIWGKIKNAVTGNLNNMKTSAFGMWDSFQNKAVEAGLKVRSAFSNLGTFFDNLWNIIKSKFTTIGTGIGNAVGNAFRSVINAVLSRAQSVLNAPIRAINSLISSVNAIPGIYVPRLSTFSLPRMAMGGIINMPNRGVNIGGAIAGESGREGILPLTDTQAMQTLGEEIGKWITINANIVNEMDGKVLSRQVRKIQAQEDFAFNS